MLFNLFVLITWLETAFGPIMGKPDRYTLLLVLSSLSKSEQNILPGALLAFPRTSQEKRKKERRVTFRFKKWKEAGCIRADKSPARNWYCSKYVQSTLYAHIRLP